MKLSKFILICFVSGLVSGTCGLAQVQIHEPATPVRQMNYNAEHIAAAETAMWRAYYSKDRIAGKIRLGMLLTQLLQEQFELKQFEATPIAYLLSSSAMLFKQGKYDAALPPLKEAYTDIKKYTSLNFDPEKVAKADLKWWVARRSKPRKSPEVIGQDITHLYELIYGHSHQGFTDAGLLRAKAMQLRDVGQDKADWEKIEKLLVASWKAMQCGIENRQSINNKAR
ncbi:MAG: hypothetical protein WC071_13370 [Victivallaceae bacterium]